MSFQPLTAIVTILGGLTVAAIIAWIRKPQLFLLVPRMFSHSHLTDRGQLVEVTVFNRGFKTEEAIEITLNPLLKYEILGSNSQDVVIERNKVKISRIGASDEVTSLLMVENGIFKKDDITQCLSKETKGKIVSKLEEVSPTGPQRIGVVAGIIGFSLLGFFFTSGIDFVVDKFSQITISDTKSPNKIVEVNDWSIPKFYARDDAFLYNAFSNKKIKIDLSVSAKKNDFVTINVKFTNKTDQVIKVTRLEMLTTESENRVPSYDRAITDLLLLPEQTTEKKIKISLTPNARTDMDKTVFVEAFIEDNLSDSLSLKKRYLIE